MPSALPEHLPYTSMKGFSSTTICGLFVERCRATPDRVAIREKDLGIYQEITWRQYREHVENFCLGLVELGLEQGGRVAVMGDPCPEWLYADMACVAAGGITYGIYSTCSPDQVKYHMQDGAARFFVAQNQEFVDKVLAVADELPDLRHIVVADTRAMFAYRDPRIITFEKVEEIGADVKDRKPGLFDELVARVQPDDPFAITYTSGSTGKPKGATFTHRAYLWGYFGAVETIPTYLDEDARAVSYMPLAHLAGRLYDVYLPLLGGYIVHFGESADTVQETLFDVSPSLYLGAPRTYEKLAAQVLVGVEGSTVLKKAAFRLAMAIGRRYRARAWSGKARLHWKALYGLAYWTVFRPILDKLGLARVQAAVVTAAPVPPEIHRLWQIWGLNLREQYGQTEAGPIGSQRGAFPEPGSCGTAAPRVRLKWTEDGELLVSGPGTFAGYWRNEAATRRTIIDGWVHTGDVVTADDQGRMKVIDRAADIAVTAGGKNISLAEIEKALKGSPYISEAVVCAHGRRYPVALVEIDFDAVSEWARRNDITYTSFQSLTRHPKVLQLITREVEKGNAGLARAEQVKSFRLLPMELDPEQEDDPITPNRKVQRRQMYERFKDLVEEQYSSADSERIATWAGAV